MPELLVDLETAQTEAPLYQRIADSIRNDVTKGRLRRGERVPSTRALARELRVNRNTVAQAFEQLVADGFLEGRHGSGTYVARELPQAQPAPTPAGPALAPLKTLALANTPAPHPIFNRILSSDGPAPIAGVDIDLRLGAPDLHAFPLRQWRRCVTNQLAVPRRDRMNYGSAWGWPDLRKAVASYLGRARGIDCTYRNVLITNGSQQGLWLAASLLADPGDCVMMEDPGYLGARSVLSSLGARIVPITVDEQGVRPEAVARAAAAKPVPKLLYLTPGNQCPTGVTLGAARRLDVLKLAAQHGFMIVEDDYDGEFRYEGRPVRSLAGIDTSGVVCHVGSFSKVLFPSLRVGYVVAPPWLVEAMVALRWHVDFMPSTLESAALAQFISEGHFERHLRRMRALYAEKRAAFVAAMRRHMPRALPTVLPPGGMKLGLNVPVGMSREEAQRLALRAGVRLFDLGGCWSDPARAPARLVMGFTAVSIAKLEEAAARIARAWRG